MPGEKPSAGIKGAALAGTLWLLWNQFYNIDKSDPGKFEYLIAAASGSDVPAGWKEYTVPAMTWAVFPCTAETIGKTEAQAITRWLPKSNYRPLNTGYLTGRMKSGAPDIEYYGKDGLVEVWVAVEEKQRIGGRLATGGCRPERNDKV